MYNDFIIVGPSASLPRLAPDNDIGTGWYRNLGQGMGATLNIAAAMNVAKPSTIMRIHLRLDHRCAL